MKLQKGNKTATSQRLFVKENVWKCSVTGARRRTKIAIAILKWRINFGARSPTVSRKKLYEKVSKLTTAFIMGLLLISQSLALCTQRTFS